MRLALRTHDRPNVRCNVGVELRHGGTLNEARARSRDRIFPHVYATDPGRRASFEREAMLLASVSPLYIAAVYGLERGADISALVIDLDTGPSLADVIARAPLEQREARELALQIAAGLEAAHDRGIVHRDSSRRTSS